MSLYFYAFIAVRLISIMIIHILLCVIDKFLFCTCIIMYVYYLIYSQDICEIVNQMVT